MLRKSPHQLIHPPTHPTPGGAAWQLLAAFSLSQMRRCLIVVSALVSVLVFVGHFLSLTTVFSLK